MKLCVCCIFAPTTDSLLSTLESSVQHIVREDERKAWRYTADLAKLRARPVRFGGGDYASDDDGNDDGNVDAGDVSDDDADGQYDFDDAGDYDDVAVAAVPTTGYATRVPVPPTSGRAGAMPRPSIRGDGGYDAGSVGRVDDGASLSSSGGSREERMPRKSYSRVLVVDRGHGGGSGVGAVGVADPGYGTCCRRQACPPCCPTSCHTWWWLCVCCLSERKL